jgi:hypothetical protein
MTQYLDCTTGPPVSLSAPATPSPTASITPTPSVTPSVGSSITVNVSHNAAAETSMYITGVQIGTSALSVSPAFPYDYGESGSGSSPEPAGTYTITVSLGGSITSACNINVNDSNSTNHCDDTVDGPGDYVFTGCVMNSSQAINITFNGGDCA